MNDFDSRTMPALLVTVCVSAALSWLLLRVRSSGAAVERVPPHEKYFESLEVDPSVDHFQGVGPGYRWSQTDSEVELCVPVDAEARARNVSLDITSRTISLSCAEKCILQGRLFRGVKSDECDWKLEGSGDSRMLTITLTKAISTRGNQHWTSLLALLNQ